jgi:prepilin-type N-terminal cleavage/methylation domain-containing protein
MNNRRHAFTLTELLVSITILAILVLVVSRLLISASNIAISGNKRMDADGQVRPLFERFAVDLAQMVKRSDADFFGKGTGAPNSVGGAMPGNDQFAFYSTVPGYHLSGVSPSPVSLVAYRIGTNKLERMAKALGWNGASSSGLPIVFLPLTIAGNWTAATNTDSDSDYELIGPYVFRFEYSYVLKNGALSVTPWDSTAGHTGVGGLQDVAAISISIGTLDPRSRQLITDEALAALGRTMNDFSPSMGSGDLLAQWQGAVNDATGLPRPSLAAVRLYERTFSLAPTP